MSRPTPTTEPAASGQLTKDTLRLLADPAQEVLLERPPAFSQLAPVPLPDLDSATAAGLSFTHR
jgi:hypothetical protein